MDSKPPAAMTSAEPARIWSAASITARMAEPHILLTVVVGVPTPNPAPSAACLAGAWPRPADNTQPMITSSMSPAATAESAMAASSAAEPSCGPVTVANAP